MGRLASDLSQEILSEKSPRYALGAQEYCMVIGFFFRNSLQSGHMMSRYLLGDYRVISSCVHAGSLYIILYLTRYIEYDRCRVIWLRS